jgi:glycosyltransferase involved in cell wall biosynthesis
MAGDTASLRILLVNSHGADAAVGGAEKYVADLVGGLEPRGHDVSVVSAFPVRSNPWPDRTTVVHDSDWRDDRIRRLRNHAGDLVSRPGRRLAALLSAERPDVVHTNNLPGITTAIWEICRRLGIPVVHTVHDYYLLCPRVTLLRRDGSPCSGNGMLHGVRTARLTRWADAVNEVIFVSEHVRRRHEGIFRSARSHIVRIPIPELPDGKIEPAGTPPRTIGYLGALERAKGIESLLDAAPELARFGYTVRIAGNGRLRRLAEEAAASGHVRYLGTIHGEEKTRFISETDLAVLPSRWEEPGAPPYSVAEWIAARRPILLSRRGGLDEVVEHVPGAIGIEGDARSIVEAARRLLDYGPWTEALEAARAGGRSGVERWLDAHEEVYESAFARAPRQENGSPAAARAGRRVSAR